MIDTHCHLDYPPAADNVEAALDRAAAAGVEQVVHIGCSPERMQPAVDLADTHERVFAVVGIHPHDAKHTDSAILERLGAYAEHPKVVALGETGLDYHYDYSPREDQRRSFAQHIELARTLDMPLVLHVRDAHEEAWNIVDQTGSRENPGIVHCFTGNADQAQQWIDRGWHISFSGIATFKQAAEIREAAQLCPAERILLETDAPFLAPEPLRGRKNEPANVTFTCTRLAELRGESAESLALQASENARRLLRLPLPA